MLISVSFSPLKEHISVLELEKDTVQRIRKSLEPLYQQARECCPENAELYRQQIAFTDMELVRIQKRKELLEQTLDVFVNAKESYTESVSEVRSILRKNI